MIVHSLVCENFLKYRRLALDDLPRQGVITIAGPNESGKSAIGEALCFALFGRTFALDETQLEKLVHWGEGKSSVRLEMSAGDGRYRIERLLDRDGSHSACLWRAGDSDHPLARGVETVAEVLYGILGYRMDEFVESFYLAQREITTPHPHSQSVRMMAGIAPVEACRLAFQEEIGREREAVGEVRERTGEMEEQIRTLGFDARTLESLEAERRVFSGHVVRIREQRDRLVATADDFQEREPRLRDAEASRSTAVGVRLLLLALVLVVLGVWAAFEWLPEQPLVQWFAGALWQVFPHWQNTWVLYLGAALGVLLVLAWARVAGIDRRIRALRGCGGRLTRELGALSELESSLPGEVRGDQGGDTDGETDEVPTLRADPDQRDRLCRLIDRAEAGVNEVREAVERDGVWLDQCTGRLQRRIAELGSEIGRQQARREKHLELEGRRAAYEQQQAEHQERIRLRELADELLLGTSRHLSLRFNHNLRDLVSRTLPLFTEGRYQHLQIDEDLAVRAFSSDKRDFLDLDEISSGTQRQIMLALRLALSQELIDRVARGPQFLFLDEPCAFFDDNRTRSALEVLSGLGEGIDQVWIVAQAFPDDMDFALRLVCDRERDALVSPGADEAPATPESGRAV